MIDVVPWPSDWDARVAGTVCRHCAEGRPEDWSDVLAVGRAVDSYFKPMKVNYMILGNQSPHLHAHVTARYLDDPAPGGPLPAGMNRVLPEADWRADAAALRRLLLA
jgi:diadenosine tetraphosphate (Ap4A) HIT family hydrolase